jgi:hypothetical protein
MMIKIDGIAVGFPGASLPYGSATNSSGESWIEQEVLIPAGNTLLEVGLLWNSIRINSPMYLNELEVIKQEDQDPEYQYFMKDHLGNVRLTFTSKTAEPENFTTDFDADDQGTFQNYSTTTFDLVDHTDAGTVYQNAQYLNGGTNGRVGVAKTFPVMPGDMIRATAYGKYVNLSGSPNTNALITSLAAAFGVSASSTGEQLAAYEGLNSYANLVASGDHVNDDESAPKAFVTILFFDKDHNLVDAAWDQMTTTG